MDVPTRQMPNALIANKILLCKSYAIIVALWEGVETQKRGHYRRWHIWHKASQGVIHPTFAHPTLLLRFDLFKAQNLLGGEKWKLTEKHFFSIPPTHAVLLSVYL